MSDAERRRHSFRVLRDRDFAVFWSAALVSNTGSWMQTIAVPFVVYQMTHSTTWLGFAAFMKFIPAMIVGPLGGSLADRHSRKTILLVTQTVHDDLAFALWGVWVAGAATPWIIVAIVFVSGFVAGINITTWQAFVTQLVDPRRAGRRGPPQLDAVHGRPRRSVPRSRASCSRRAGASAAFFVNAVSFLLVLGALLLVHPRAAGVLRRRRRRVSQHLREGWRFVRDPHRAVRSRS